jgi:hypothetical protein
MLEVGILPSHFLRRPIQVIISQIAINLHEFPK